jgi:hypothetical protein
MIASRDDGFIAEALNALRDFFTIGCHDDSMRTRFETLIKHPYNHRATFNIG